MAIVNKVFINKINKKVLAHFNKILKILKNNLVQQKKVMIYLNCITRTTIINIDRKFYHISEISNHQLKIQKKKIHFLNLILNLIIIRIKQYAILLIRYIAKVKMNSMKKKYNSKLILKLNHLMKFRFNNNLIVALNMD